VRATFSPLAREQLGHRLFQRLIRGAPEGLVLQRYSGLKSWPMSRVKGLAFRSVLRAHTLLRGEQALDGLYSHLEPSIAHTMRAPLAATWYPLSLYVALWDAIQRTTGGDQDYPRLVGRLCAEHDLKLVHKVLFATLNSNVALKVTARMFGSYYDTGTCSANRIDDRSFRFLFEGCVGFSEPMWMELHGSLEVFVDLSTNAKSQSQLVQGGQIGASSRIVDIRW